MINGKIISLIILMALIIPLVNADSMATVKQNNCIDLKATCSNCTYVNLTGVDYDGGIPAIKGNFAMTQLSPTLYNYTFCYTDRIGLYTYHIFGNPDGNKQTDNPQFEVTPSGFLNNLGFYIILIVIISGVLIVGFAFKEEWFVMIGGILLILLGLYSINYGIAGFRDMFITWGIGLFEIGIGFILTMMAGESKMGND